MIRSEPWVFWSLAPLVLGHPGSPGVLQVHPGDVRVSYDWTSLFICVPETTRTGDASADGKSRRRDSGVEGDLQLSAAGGRHQNQEAEEGRSWTDIYSHKNSTSLFLHHQQKRVILIFKGPGSAGLILIHHNQVDWLWSPLKNLICYTQVKSYMFFSFIPVSTLLSISSTAPHSLQFNCPSGNSPSSSSLNIWKLYQQFQFKHLETLVLVLWRLF